MKKILVALSMLMLVSCNKEESSPPAPSPTQPAAPGDNYLVANSLIWSNDTFRFNYLYGAFDPVNDSVTVIWNRDTTASQSTLIHLETNLMNSGSDSIHNSTILSMLSLNGIMYAVPEMQITISRYDDIGGLIEGNYEGYWVRSSSPWDTIQIDGVFSVPRYQ